MVKETVGKGFACVLFDWLFFLCEGWQIAGFKFSSMADVQLIYLFYNKKVTY